MRHIRFYFLCSCLVIIALGNNVRSYAELAIIQVPVADLIGQPVPYSSSSEVVAFFHNLPPAKEPGFRECIRLHQALFHEIVTVLERKGVLVHLSLENIFFETGGKKYTDYWTLERNIFPLSKINSVALTEKLPPAISFEAKNSITPVRTIASTRNLMPHHRAQEVSTVTLKEPWYDAKTARTYSAGTRFVCAHETPANQSYVIYIFHAPTKTMVTTSIPKRHCIRMYQQSPKDKIKLFVTILTSWAHGNKNIPYVWGGSSFTKRYPPEACTIKTFPNYVPTIKDIPKTGFDCSGLIARAAQIAKMPFFYKNSVTMAHYLRLINRNEHPENGDIIWIPGHVMVVSNSEKNLLIEAGAYSYGYGFVHEMPLSKQFKGISTYHDLHNALLKRHPLIRLHRSGNEKQRIKEFKILKMTSAWQANNN